MALTDKIVKGMFIMFRDEPHLIIEREFYKPGKGNALNRTKLKNLKNGKVIAQTYKSGEKVEELTVETKTMIFSYNDNDNAYFMDQVTYDQVTIPMDMIPSGTDFLLVEGKYVVTFYEGEALSVQLPPKVTLAVTDTSDATKGNTASNATKEATVETGFSLQVPLFIKVGDRIVINTELGQYYSKEN